MRLNVFIIINIYLFIIIYHIFCKKIYIAHKYILFIYTPYLHTYLNIIYIYNNYISCKDSLIINIVFIKYDKCILY